MANITEFKTTEKEAPEHYKWFSYLYSHDRYKYLYYLMQSIWRELKFQEQKYDNDTMFVYKDLLCCVDKIDGSYCEVLNSGWLPIAARVMIHEKKLQLIKCYNDNKRKRGRHDNKV